MSYTNKAASEDLPLFKKVLSECKVCGTHHHPTTLACRRCKQLSINLSKDEPLIPRIYDGTVVVNS